MEAHYDPAYARSIGKNYPQIAEATKLGLSRLDRASLLDTARQLHQEPPAV
jgi:tRNA 2-selenouridine synthase